MHRPLSDLNTLSSDQFLEFVRGRHAQERGCAFDEHESELWRWGFENRAAERQIKARH